MPPHGINVVKQESDRAAALKLVPVSRETGDRLAIFVDLLARWRKVTNLISEATFAEVWLRHIADSAQLLALAPQAKRWVDLGSGAGFPGMVLAIQLADTPGAQVHLIESDQRKCAFLREVARATGATAQIHAARIESIAPEALMPVDAVTARAFAPLPILLDFAKVWLAGGAVGVFPRGKTTEAQLRDAPNSTGFRFETVSSRIDARAAILIVRGAESAQHFNRQ
ncbi:16S rRNA (guanine(527)-N(7))-methyltransferase RsmG [Methylocapsa sp. S129]|uniref:16S rRNA (guanine(527)-N(7))-methyltransferase RsmG n=1 Tax=Methylocapsa sp. S129 TaxID=1641869 RepID=UPI00131B44D4|nr:16S rRNA (guanine(527)-N(7))-methyltransferase RsmG [Methylocapsa sp. S129]